MLKDLNKGRRKKQCMMINQVKWSMQQLLAREGFRFFSLGCFVLAEAHPSCLGNKDNTSLFPLLPGGILFLLLKLCLFGLWNYKFHVVPPVLMGLNPDISYQQVEG